MKQLWQSVSTGEAAGVDVPASRARKGQILVRVMASLLSAGTEQTVMEFAEKNLMRKVARLRLGEDKGRRDEWKTFAGVIRNGGQSPVSFNEILNSTLATFALVHSSLDGSWIEVSTERFLAAARDSFPPADYEMGN